MGDINIYIYIYPEKLRFAAFGQFFPSSSASTYSIFAG